MVNCQDINSHGVCYFVDNSIITKNDLSYFIFSADFWNHSSNPGISLDVFCYINYSLRVNSAYLAESFEMYSAIDFKSVRDL